MLLQIKTMKYLLEEDFWPIATEWWLVKNAPTLKWDFDRPEYGLEQAMAQIARCFDRRWCETPRTGCDAEGPIFIVGLPRSGTTLVERMLGRHADVGSVGEVNDLPLAVTRIAGGAG